MHEDLPLVTRLGKVQGEIKKLGLSYESVEGDMAEMRKAAGVLSIVHAVDITTPQGREFTGTIMGGLFMGEGRVEIPVLYTGQRVDENIEEEVRRNREALGLPAHVADVREIYATLGLNDAMNLGQFYLSESAALGEHSLDIKRYVNITSSSEGWRRKGRWPLTDVEFSALSAVSFAHDFNHVFNGKLQVRPHRVGVSAESTA